MADAYLGQIELFACGLIPRNWAPCDGRLLSQSQYQSLFALLGTTFGGDGITTFAVPDLRGRTVLGIGPGYVMGQQGGEEFHVLTSRESPPTPDHSHPIGANATNTTPVSAPSSTSVLAKTTGTISGGSSFSVNLYAAGAAAHELDSRTIGPVGGEAHENRMPFLAMNYCICCAGPFPIQMIQVPRPLAIRDGEALLRQATDADALFAAIGFTGTSAGPQVRPRWESRGS